MMSLIPDLGPSALGCSVLVFKQYRGAGAGGVGGNHQESHMTDNK